MKVPTRHALITTVVSGGDTKTWAFEPLKNSARFPRYVVRNSHLAIVQEIPVEKPRSGARLFRRMYFSSSLN